MSKGVIISCYFHHSKKGDKALIEHVKKILRQKDRHDLANLLKHAKVDFNVSDNYGTLLFSQQTTLEIYVPYNECEKLKSISKDDYELLLDVVLEVQPPKENDIEITEIKFFVDPEALPDTDEEIINEIEAQKNIMIAVSTGGPRINSVNKKYKERRKFINEELSVKELRNPNPYEDLWEWYGKWSSGDLPTYQSRREYINSLFAPLIKTIREGSNDTLSEQIFEEPTGWARVDRNLTEIRKSLETAENEEQYQAVGLLCRECLITLAQMVYDAEKHDSLDGTKPSKTDAKRMLEAYIQKELSGSSNKVARKHAKASLDLANNLQHKRSAKFRQAALCAEATISVVNIIAIISGIRDP